MSTVYIHIGQCGNQVGSRFLESLINDSSGAVPGPFKHYDGTFRSVHVDSEPKVIQKLLNSEIGKFTRRESTIIGKRGCGSNWGCGYHESCVLDQTTETIRKEVERCDFYSGCVLIHSLSGGTGSGLTSRLVEEIRDQFPLHHIMSIAVAPHWSGESPLQHYNTALCLGHLQSTVDAVMVFSNDTVLQTLEATHKGGKHKHPISDSGFSYQDLNDTIASHLSGCFLPVESRVNFGNEPWELFRTCCPIPELKFLSVYQQISRKSLVSWLETSRHLARLVTASCSGQNPRTVSALAVARGHTGSTFLSEYDRVSRRLKADLRCVAWNPFPLDFWVEPYRKQEGSIKSLTVAFNSNMTARYLSRVLEVAEGKFSAKAYVHWYLQHGCEENDFEQVFDSLRKVVNNYEHFTMS